MRHLRVPSDQTQVWLHRCRQEGWLSKASVLQLDEGMRGIPLLDEAPDNGDERWQGHNIVHREPKQQGPSHWTDRLPDPLQALPDDIWPSAYEIQGDVLMVKLEANVIEHQQAIAEAMLAQLPNVRIVCADNGVAGDFRVRELTPIASRDGNLSTRTRIREHGMTMWVDPSEAYFSARLSTQRQGTLEQVRSLRQQLGRPVVVADPYAGVGPALPLLLSDPDLVSGYLVGDLNPKAVDLLTLNLETWSAKHVGNRSPSLVVCDDARAWQHDPSRTGVADALLVNLPHDSLTHLPTLLPILNHSERRLLRGWAIIERAALEQTRGNLIAVIEAAGATAESVDVEEIKGFSTTRCFIAFNAILAWE